MNHRHWMLSRRRRRHFKKQRPLLEREREALLLLPLGTSASCCWHLARAKTYNENVGLWERRSLSFMLAREPWEQTLAKMANHKFKSQTDTMANECGSSKWYNFIGHSLSIKKKPCTPWPSSSQPSAPGIEPLYIRIWRLVTKRTRTYEQRERDSKDTTQVSFSELCHVCP